MDGCKSTKIQIWETSGSFIELEHCRRGRTKRGGTKMLYSGMVKEESKYQIKVNQFRHNSMGHILNQPIV